MLPRNHPSRIRIDFGDHRLVSKAGLLLAATSAPRLGLPQMVQGHLDDAPGRANTSVQLMMLVASARTGGAHGCDDARTSGKVMTLLQACQPLAQSHREALTWVRRTSRR